MTRPADLIVQTRRLVTSAGERSGSVHVKDGRIADVVLDRLVTNDSVLDVGNLVVMPGLIDTHVHVNEPGRTDWEGFDTATRAAAAGGVTTLVDMPLNSIPATTSVEALSAKRRAAEGRCWVDVGFWGGVVPGNLAELVPLAREGVLGFKCFLVPSGVDEFSHVSATELRSALTVLEKIDRVLLVHAELPDVIEAAGDHLKLDPTSYANYLASRPDEAERGAIALVAGLAGETGAAVHIVHVSSAHSLPVIETARRRGAAVTSETCPHYLFFDAEVIPDKATAFKCAPPVRRRAHREALWEALRQGTIDLVASDHSPSPPRLKCLETGDFQRAWGGIASMELGLAAMWSGAHTRGFDPVDIARLMAERPAALAGFADRKGRLAVGYDADLVVWDPNATFTVDQRALWQRHPLTPYHGVQLRGRVETTFLRGMKVYDRGQFGREPRGVLLERRA